MSKLLKLMIYEMYSYSTPMAPFVKEVVDYVVKFFVGEEFILGSDIVSSNNDDKSKLNL